MNSQDDPARRTTKEISLEEYEEMRGRRPAPKTGQEAQRILTRLKPNRPILIEKATRGLQMALSRRINRESQGVEIKVEKIGDRRNIALLKRET